MKTYSIGLYTVLVCTSLVAAPQSTFADDNSALRDAGFELKLAPDEGGWILFDESMISRDEARSGSQSMFHWGFSRSVAYAPYFVGTVSGSFQEFPAEPGSRWRLTGYGAAPATLKGTPAFGILQLSFFDADGNDLGTVETANSDAAKAKTSNEVNRKTPADEWVFLDTGVATAPAGAATVQAFTLYVDYSGSNTTQGVYFDDLSLCAVDDNETGCEELKSGMQVGD
ncbi:MAG: hypothetical protein WBN61_13875 [Woeseiaceae bacterium]